ncbi:MAG: hypothetical protein U0798_00800 [Gemmataceae bacterium]
MRVLTVLLFVLVAGAFASFAPAAPPIPTVLSPEADEWYRWRIVLKVKPHPLLGKDVRQQLAREISAAVAPAVSKFAEVDVVDLASVPAEKKAPLWVAFEKDGWSALDQQPFRELTGIKTHFLTIEFKSGVYHLESKQHDGNSGMSSPVLRVNETRAAEQIARLAGQMLFPDFGMIATVIGGKETDSTGLLLKVRGSGRVPIDDLVKVGDIFSVSMITKQDPFADRPRQRGKTGSSTAPVKPPAMIGTTKEYTLLKAITSPNPDGTIRCEVITRFETGLPTTMSGLIGVRAMKVYGTSTPVRVKVVTKDGKLHPRASLLTVFGTDGDYGVNPGPRDGFSFNSADGTFRSARPLQSIACLIVGLSPSYSERFPVALTGNNLITVVMSDNEETARKAELEKTTMDLRMRIGEAHQALSNLFATTGRLVGEGRNRDALDRVVEGLKTAESVDQLLQADLERIRKLPGAKMEDCEQQLKTFREWREKLKSYEQGLTAAAKLDPLRMEKDLRIKDLVERIKTLREQGEVPEALLTYDELIDLSKNNDYKIEKEKLARIWAPQDAAHQAAREVLLIKWPSTQSVDDFSKLMKPFSDAANVMMKKDDRLGVRKLFNSFNLSYSKLKALLEKLDANVAEDKVKLDQINNLMQDLKTLETTVRTWLEKSTKK